MPEKSHLRPFFARVGGVFMSAQKTEHYQLHQWDPGDDFLRAEFNENFAALDKSVRIVFGSYTGDGAAERTISLGFTPKAVLLLTSHGTTWGGREVYGGLALTDHPSKATYNQTVPVVKIVPGGFQVYVFDGTFYVKSNVTNYSFHYLAIY